MYKHIMLPLDGSELSAKTVKESVAFAKSIGAKVTAIHVISHYHVILDKVENLAKAEGVECEGMVVVGDHPYREIIDHAAKRKCDLILMASHGRRGLEGLLLGSETVKVLTHSKIPVLVVR